jgi:hypothetical protein
MSVAVRRFERRDRDQPTSLVNLHVAAVIPGVVLSVNAVLSQLEREPYENVVDPWVAKAALAQMDAWQVTVAGAECNLPGLTGRHQPQLSRTRTLGLPGARFSLERDGTEIGFIEVCDHSAEMARSSPCARWADVNLIVPDERQLSWAMPQLLAAAANGCCSAGSQSAASNRRRPGFCRKRGTEPLLRIAGLGAVRPPAPGASEELPEIVAVDPGVAEDPGESAALELAVKRDHERSRVLFVLEGAHDCRAGGRRPSRLSQARPAAAGRTRPAAARSRRQRKRAPNDPHLE